MRIQNRLGLIETVETLLAQERRMTQVSNNLANVNTSGFKKENQTFWEILFTTTSGRQRVGKANRVIIDQGQGSMQETGNPLDIAISGHGLFKIDTPRGIRYTRNGNFLLNNQGQLITHQGDTVQGEGGPITISGNDVVIGLDGQMVVDGEQADRLAIVRFPEPEGLEKEGENLLRPKEGGPAEEPAEDFTVNQGFLEMSNVNTVQEMTEMIDLYRAYEIQQRVIKGIDNLDDQAIRRVGSLAL